MEREAAGRTAEERPALRQAHSRPVDEELGRCIAETSRTVPPKSPLGKALYYAAHQRAPLGRFLEDGRLELHNNACERALRRIAVGRNNWVFAGSDAGGERAAVIYTVLGTCRLRGIGPWAWVRDVLEKLASAWKQARIAEPPPGESADAVAA